MSAALGYTPSLAGRVGRLIGIWLVFVILGPPVGGLTFVALARLATTFGVLDHLRPELMSTWPPELVFIGVAFGYLLGALPLAVAGLAVGIHQAFFGPTSWWMALGIGLVAGVVLVKGEDVAFEAGGFQAMMILTCVVTTMLFSWVVRGWHYASATAERAP
jgi:hypothetical protein